MKSPEYFMHGTSSEVDAEKIIEDGFKAKEGRATVSTDFIMAFRWASDVSKRDASKSETLVQDDESGRIIVMKPTNEQRVDYGKDTSIEVDSDEKTISGNVSRYQANRRYLAIYENKNEVTNVKVPKENILISIVPSEELGKIIFDLKSKIDSFEKIDVEDVVNKISNIIQNDDRNMLAPEVNVGEIVENLVVSTIENEVMNIVRKYSIRVKRSLGYTVENKTFDTRMEPVEDKNDLLNKLESYKAKIESGDIDTGFEHLNRYLKTSITSFTHELGS